MTQTVQSSIYHLYVLTETVLYYSRIHLRIKFPSYARIWKLIQFLQLLHQKRSKLLFTCAPVPMFRQEILIIMDNQLKIKLTDLLVCILNKVTKMVI